MSILVHDPLACQELLAQRRATGADLHDEVWEGTYVLNPLANSEHQEIVLGLTGGRPAV